LGRDHVLPKNPHLLIRLLITQTLHLVCPQQSKLNRKFPHR